MRDGPAQHSTAQPVGCWGRIFTTTTSGSSAVAGWLCCGVRLIFIETWQLFRQRRVLCVCVCVRDISPYIVYTWDVTVYLIPASVLGRPVVFSSLFQPGERESQVQPSGEQSSISSTANPFAVRCISHPSDEPFCPSFPPIDWRNSTLCRCSRSLLHLSSTVTTLRR